MDASEGRVRALQRIAYGADATDAERARAVAELDEIAVRGGDRDEAGRAGGVGDRGDADGPGTGEGAGEADETEGDAGAGPPDDVTSGRGRLVRWTAAAGGIGLLFGAALGWTAGHRVAVDSAAPTVSASPAEEPGTPLEETDLLPLFDRLPLADESARVASVDDAIDPESVRLLATRVDGPAAFLTRTVDGENVCLVLLLPAGPSRIECTVDGLLPADGLSILYGAQGYGLAAARLATTGTVSLGLIVTF
ncbi:hypothetical protein [Agromyces albus]|uniref:hypothetical protein n=1 Tax=Agromyces albus TaxID=205332 RepID=UPI00278462DB|nr:hypothetical protein [Agromyces albus]MDQ0576860.1 hypothetical protein [Agromyces albus]